MTTKLTAAQVVAELERLAERNLALDPESQYYRGVFEGMMEAATLVRENLVPTWLDAPTAEGWYFVEGDYHARYIRRSACEWWIGQHGYNEPLSNRRVCPIGERPSEATNKEQDE